MQETHSIYVEMLTVVCRGSAVFCFLSLVLLKEGLVWGDAVETGFWGEKHQTLRDRAEKAYLWALPRLCLSLLEWGSIDSVSTGIQEIHVPFERQCLAKQSSRLDSH